MLGYTRLHVLPPSPCLPHTPPVQDSGNLVRSDFL